MLMSIILFSGGLATVGAVYWWALRRMLVRYVYRILLGISSPKRDPISDLFGFLNLGRIEKLRGERMLEPFRRRKLTLSVIKLVPTPLLETAIKIGVMRESRSTGG
jgi:hypothetical protein